LRLFFFLFIKKCSFAFLSGGPTTRVSVALLYSLVSVTCTNLTLASFTDSFCKFRFAA
jgi:hypothetical protein